MSGSAPSVTHVLSGDQWAGAEVQAFHLMDALAARGAYAPRAILFNEGRTAERLRAAAIPVDVVAERGRSFPALVRGVRRLLGGDPPAVVHGHGYKENLVSVLASRGIGAARIRTQHSSPFPGGRLPYALYYALDRWLAARAFRFTLAVSEGIAAEASRFLPADRIVLVRNGIPAPDEGERAAVSPFPEDSPVVVSVGRLSPEKRFDRLIDAVALLRRSEPEVALLLVGDGPERARLEAKANAVLPGRCRFAGFQEAVGPWIRSGRVYAVSSDREGMPMSLLEALARGVPVAAVPVGGIAEVVRPGASGVLAAAVTAEALADAIGALLRDEGLRKRVAEGGKAVVAEGYSIEKTAAETEAVYGLARGRA